MTHDYKATIIILIFCRCRSSGGMHQKSIKIDQGSRQVPMASVPEAIHKQVALGIMSCSNRTS